MTRPIDTLFFQWVASDEDKAIPTVLEDISQMSEEEKVGELLGVLSHLSTDVVEAEITHNLLTDAYIQRAANDEELKENASAEDIAEAISELEDVVEAADVSDAAVKSLDLFHRALTKALVS